ncbi:MAG: biotin/lipoate protein ligase [Pelosinus sp.]|nr:biotin/lipoate protein ligase [Pelosinus sp.]
MAVDEAIMLAHSQGEVPPTLRFYGWRPAAISLGYFQQGQKEIDLQECDRLGIDIVRRLTGGRAVLHEAELTYSIVVQEKEPSIPPTISASYRYFSKGLLAGLEQLGIIAQMSMPREVYSHTKPKKDVASSSACFDAPSHYEITYGGRKLVGSAQVRKHGVILQHGSLLLKFSSEKTAAVLGGGSLERKKAIGEILNRRATSIEEILGRSVEWQEVYDAMRRAFALVLGVEFKEDNLSKKEVENAQQLATLKYNQLSWNLMR